MHSQSTVPQGSLFYFIVPSHLHKQCARNTTAQWEMGKREAAMWGNGRESAGGLLLSDGLWLMANGTP